MKNKITVAGLFVGCGGLDYGFQQAGFDIFWANESSLDAAKSYEKFVKHDVIVDDVWNVIDEVPEVDVLVGGPPCQSFSLIGKRLDEDPRSKLVFAYESAVEKTHPKVFVMENVAGLTASYIDGNRLHIHLANKFEKMGYHVTILKLTATDYFVPQRRNRIVMIGHRIKGKTFNMIESSIYAKLLKEPNLKKPTPVSDALDDLPEPLVKGSKESALYNDPPHCAYSRLMRKKGNERVSHQVMPTMSVLDREFVRHIPPGGNYTDIPDSISTKRIMSFKKSGGRTTTYGRLHHNMPSYTINTYFNRPNVGANYHHKEERLITVREAMRLQSFPDHFSPVYSNQRSLHQQIGNAVPPLMARALAESVKRLFE